MRLISTLKQSSCTVDFYATKPDSPNKDLALVVNGLRLKDKNGVPIVYPTLEDAWTAARKAIVS